MVGKIRLIKNIPGNSIRAKPINNCIHIICLVLFFFILIPSFLEMINLLYHILCLVSWKFHFTKWVFIDIKNVICRVKPRWFTINYINLLRLFRSFHEYFGYNHKVLRDKRCLVTEITVINSMTLTKLLSTI